MRYLDLKVGDAVPAAERVKVEEAPAPSGLRVWIVVVSNPGQERLARLNLDQQGFEPYLPMRLAMNRRKQELVAMPFFPRYLFARTGLAMSEWGKIWNTRGVHGVLGHGDRPIGVANMLIERIRAQEEGGYIKIGLEADAPRFEPGERVVTTDEFGFEGVFQERVDEKRAMILVSFLGRDSRFTVDLRKLRSAGGS